MTLSESIARLDVDAETRAALEARVRARPDPRRAAAVAARLPISDHSAARARRRHPVPRVARAPGLRRVLARDRRARRAGAAPRADALDRRLVRQLPQVALRPLPRARAARAAPAGLRAVGARELRLAVLHQPDGRDRVRPRGGLRRRRSRRRSCSTGSTAGSRATTRAPPAACATGSWARTSGGRRPSWPPPHEEERWFLHSGGPRNALGDGVLSGEAPGDEERDAFVYDPLDPVPTVYGKTLMPTILPAGHRRPDVRSRSGTTSSATRSQAITEPLAVNGAIRVELWASSSAPSTPTSRPSSSTSRPDGYAMNLADGIVRARYRESPRTRSAPLEPGRADALHDRPLGPCAHVPAGAPAAARGQLEQLPALRPEHEHRPRARRRRRRRRARAPSSASSTTGPTRAPSCFPLPSAHDRRGVPTAGVR